MFSIHAQGIKSMRQAKREISDIKMIEQIILKAEVCRLGLTDGLIPYVVPLNFGYQNQCLYFHCAPEGKKLDLIKINNRVCFELEAEAEIQRDSETACHWNTKFKSVIGQGRALLVTDPAEKRKALDIIMHHYADPKDWPYGEGPLSRMIIIQVKIDSMTGKQSKHYIRTQP